MWISDANTKPISILEAKAFSILKPLKYALEKQIRNAGLKPRGGHHPLKREMPFNAE